MSIFRHIDSYFENTKPFLNLYHQKQHFPIVHYTFGSVISELSYTSDTSAKYRFGFNGEEKENDISGEGLVYDLGARFYDGRLGRMFSVDPLISEYSSWSAYSYLGNSPLIVKDLKGAGLDPDAKTGKINGTIYFKFDEKMNLSETEKHAYIDSYMKKSKNKWNNINYQTTNEDGTINKDGKTNIDDMKFKEYCGETIGENDNIFTVGRDDPSDDKTGDYNISHITGTNTGWMNYDNMGDEGPHEIAHLLGLSDRYAETVGYSSNSNGTVNDNYKFTNPNPRETIPLALPYKTDKDYNPYDNLMSVNGSVLTSMQLGIVFNEGKEKQYYQPVIVMDSYKPGHTQFSAIRVHNYFFYRKVEALNGGHYLTSKEISSNNFNITWYSHSIFGIVEHGKNFLNGSQYSEDRKNNKQIINNKFKIRN